MDRYLFRGKRIDNGAWETGFLVIEHFQCLDAKHFITDKMTGYHTPVDPATIGQCTGLKDKNDRLVFEGDIVTRISPIYQIGKNEPIGEYQPIGVVRILEDGDEPPYCTVKANDHLGNETDMLLFVKAKGWHRPWYVIGNAYDNPELLV